MISHRSTNYFLPASPTNMTFRFVCDWYDDETGNWGFPEPMMIFQFHAAVYEGQFECAFIVLGVGFAFGAIDTPEDNDVLS